MSPALHAGRSERRDALAGFLLLMGVMTAHGLMETARDALFLSRLPARHLPWAYLALAVLAFGAARAHGPLRNAFTDRRAVLSVTLAAAAVVTVALSLVLAGGSEWAAYVFYVWTGLVATVMVVQVWLLLENVVTVTQAKRIFGIVAAGGVSGATLGSLLADRLIGVLGAERLLLLAAALLLASGAVPFLWGRDRFEDPSAPRPRARAPRSEGTRPSLRVLWGEPYLRLLLAIVVVSTVALTGVDYVFKSIVAEEVAADQLGPFFARFYLILNAAALVVQVGVSSWLLGAFGVNRALLVLPVLLALTAGAFFVLPVLAAAAALRGADGALRHSVHRTGLEILYLPIAREVRERYKTLIDGVGGRGGQALASLAILGAVALDADQRVLVAAIALLAVGWLVQLGRIKHHYLELFRHNLREGAIETRVGLAELDLHSLEALVVALNSEHDDEVLTALDLFRLHDKVHLVPVLVLYHPSRAVVLHALDLFADAGRTDFRSVARRLLRSEDEEIRAAALRALTAIAPDEGLLRASLGDASPLVSATALVGLLSRRFGNPDRLRAALDHTLREGSAETRRALADAIRRQRDPGFTPTLLRLAQDADPTVRLAVARAVEAVPDERYLEALLPMLADGRLRGAARRAIVAVGPVALSYLDTALWDAKLPRRLRRHLPRTISRFEPRRAASVLLRHLTEEEDGAVRYKILRGLGRLRTDHPDLPLDRKLLRRLLQETLARTIRFLDWRIATEEAQEVDPTLRTAGGELLVAALREKDESALERAFRLLALLHVGEDFQLLWQGLQSEDPKTRAASREVLAHVVTGRERNAVLALVADAPDQQRLAGAASAMGDPSSRPSYDGRLVAMLSDRSEAVRSVAAYHIGELGLTELAGPLRQARRDSDSPLAEVIDRVLAVLERHPAATVHDVA